LLFCLNQLPLYCIAPRAGGYAILKGIQKGMRLPADKMMPSFANLKDYGNTSSSTTWYSFAYIETVGDVKRGQVIMQVRYLWWFEVTMCHVKKQI
jgi:3-ketoacyl-CoA synthase